MAQEQDVVKDFKIKDARMNFKKSKKLDIQIQTANLNDPKREVKKIDHKGRKQVFKKNVNFNTVA